MAGIALIDLGANALVNAARKNARPFLKRDETLVTNMPDRAASAVEHFEKHPAQSVTAEESAQRYMDYTNARMSDVNPEVYEYNPFEAKQYTGEISPRELRTTDTMQPTGTLHHSMLNQPRVQNPADHDTVKVLEGKPNTDSQLIHKDIDGDLWDQQYIVNFNKDVRYDAHNGKPHYLEGGQETQIEDISRETNSGANGYARYTTAMNEDGSQFGYLAQYQDNLTADYGRAKQNLTDERSSMDSVIDEVAKLSGNSKADIKAVLKDAEGDGITDLKAVFKLQGNPVISHDELRELMQGGRWTLDPRIKLDAALKRLNMAQENVNLATLDYKSTFQPNPANQSRAMRNVVRKSVQQALTTNMPEFRWPTSDAVRSTPDMMLPIAKAKTVYDKDMTNEIYSFVQDAGLMSKTEVKQSQQYLRGLQRGMPNKPELLETDGGALTNNHDYQMGNEPKYRKAYEAYEIDMEEFRTHYDYNYQKNNGQLIDLVWEENTGTFQYSLKLDSPAEGQSHTQSVKEMARTKGIPMFGAAGINQTTTELNTIGGDPSNAQVNQEGAATTPNQTSTQPQGFQASKPTSLADRIKAQRTPYEDRINNPQNYGVIKNVDGSVSTHRMATVEQDGKHYAFPTIVQDPMGNGGLYEFKDEDWREAFRFNKETGNVKVFDTAEEAEHYSKNYKTDSFNDYYQQQNQNTPYQHPSYKGGGGQTMNPNDAFKGGLQAMERGAKRIPGSYAELLELVADYTTPGMIVEAITGHTPSKDAALSGPIHEAMGVNETPEWETPWQNTIGTATEIIGDIVGGGYLGKGIKRL